MLGSGISPQVQAIRHCVHISGLFGMELNYRFFLVKKEIFDKTHLLPVWASARCRHRHMIPGEDIALFSAASQNMKRSRFIRYLKPPVGVSGLALVMAFGFSEFFCSIAYFHVALVFIKIMAAPVLFLPQSNRRPQASVR